MLMIKGTLNEKTYRTSSRALQGTLLYTCYEPNVGYRSGLRKEPSPTPRVEGQMVAVTEAARTGRSPGGVLGTRVSTRLRH